MTTLNSASHHKSLYRRGALSLLQAMGLLAVTLGLGACKAGRDIDAEYAQFHAKLDGEDVVVAYFKDVKWVRQSAPDLCWAAALEQALVRQGVDIDQERIVEILYPRSEVAPERNSRTTNFIGLQLHPVMQTQLRNGSSVWVRFDVFFRKVSNLRNRYVQAIGRELWSDRVVLAGIQTGPGQGHVVSVIGAAYPINTRRFTPINMRGFLLYDPMTAKPYLTSIRELYGKLELVVSVLTFDSDLLANLYCGDNCRDFMDE